MSELQPVIIQSDGDYVRCSLGELYLKDEVDKVIAEKDTEIVELKKQVHDYAQGLYVIQARAEKEIEHANYKRCLAMAEICRNEWCTLYYERKNYSENRFLDHLMAKKDRRKNIWLKIAEKFKEAK